ncbi:hypothetical protein LCGC14_1472960 [marine sediment metagenome]|uniref:Uncharacterized protein n=1 Tax=marine sediment metagenome TaxID=412755 RepID=A0A0F9JCF8_9ZZZZ
MACKICGRNSCTECFHSIEEQEEFETKTGRYALDEYVPDEEWMNAPLGSPTTPTQVPEDIDPDYEQAKADLIPESPK